MKSHLAGHYYRNFNENGIRSQLSYFVHLTFTNVCQELHTHRVWPSPLITPNTEFVRGTRCSGCVATLIIL